MKPFTITWPSVADSATVVVSGATATINVPLTFATKHYVATPTSLAPIPGYVMPEGIVRNIVLSAATGSIAGVSFTVTGYDERNDLLQEIIVGTAPGILFYQTIVSITPTTAVTATMNVGLGQNGRTILSPMDVYNKNNNFSLSYAIAGTASLTPYYTTSQVIEYSGTNQGIIQTISQNSGIYFVLPVANPNFIDSAPTSNVVPITGNSVYSFVGIPLTGLLTSVSATTGTFIQTILQQGAAY